MHVCALAIVASRAGVMMRKSRKRCMSGDHAVIMSVSPRCPFIDKARVFVYDVANLLETELS